MNLRRLIEIFQKLFSRGPVWFFFRGKSEIQSPQIRLTKRLITTVKTLKRWVSTLFIEDKRLNDEYVTAVYDLRNTNSSFDIGYFLIAAELFARKNGKNSFVVLIVPKEDIALINNGLVVNDEGLVLNDEHELQWRLENIVLPMINLCPACIGYSMLPKMSNIAEIVKGKLVYPDFYNGEYNPFDHHWEVFQSKIKFTGLRASVEGVRHIKSWKKCHNLTNKIVTITLRKYLYDPTRNSNIDEWVKFAELISRDNFTPVFIPDTFSCFEQDNKLGDFIVFSEPCWNLGLRMALYQESFMNFFVPNGPSALAHLNKKITSIGMHWVVPDSLLSTPEEYEAKGISVGQRKYDFVEGYQVLSWKEDTVENIYEEFNKFLEGYREPVRSSSNTPP